MGKLMGMMGKRPPLQPANGTAKPGTTGHYVERKTGLEPATLTLAKKKGDRNPACHRTRPHQQARRCGCGFLRAVAVACVWAECG